METSKKTMIRTAVEKMAEPIGFDIGNSDNLIQAALLNGLCKGLKNSMCESARDGQICYMVDELDQNARKIILEIATYVKLKDD